MQFKLERCFMGILWMAKQPTCLWCFALTGVVVVRRDGGGGQAALCMAVTRGCDVGEGVVLLHTRLRRRWDRGQEADGEPSW